VAGAPLEVGSAIIQLLDQLTFNWLGAWSPQISPLQVGVHSPPPRSRLSPLTLYRIIHILEARPGVSLARQGRQGVSQMGRLRVVTRRSTQVA